MMSSIIQFMVVLLLTETNKYRIVINMLTWVWIITIELIGHKVEFSGIIVINICWSFFFIIGKSIFLIVKNMDINIVDNNKFKYIFEN